jgi:hypothetical protein
MRLRAGNHGASAAAKSFTVAVMAAATIAQLLSISHEMTVRHFRCAEHGELTHVAAMVAGPAELPVRRANDALRAQENEAADAHEHCSVAFTIEGSSCAPSAGGTIGAVSPSLVAAPALAAILPGERAGVLASAPKTSPPSA